MDFTAKNLSNLKYFNGFRGEFRIEFHTNLPSNIDRVGSMYLQP